MRVVVACSPFSQLDEGMEMVSTAAPFALDGRLKTLAHAVAAQDVGKAIQAAQDVALSCASPQVDAVVQPDSLRLAYENPAAFGAELRFRLVLEDAAILALAPWEGPGDRTMAPRLGNALAILAMREEDAARRAKRWRLRWEHLDIDEARMRQSWEGWSHPERRTVAAYVAADGPAMEEIAAHWPDWHREVRDLRTRLSQWPSAVRRKGWRVA